MGMVRVAKRGLGRWDECCWCGCFACWRRKFWRRRWPPSIVPYGPTRWPATPGSTRRHGGRSSILPASCSLASWFPPTSGRAGWAWIRSTCWRSSAIEVRPGCVCWLPIRLPVGSARIAPIPTRWPSCANWSCSRVPCRLGYAPGSPSRGCFMPVTCRSN